MQIDRNIRTSRLRREKPQTVTEDGARVRLLAKILRGLLQCERFASTTDLTDTFYARLHVLRIRATRREINSAVGLVDTNADVVSLAIPRPPVRRRPASQPVSRVAAAEALDRIGLAVVNGRLCRKAS
jgi:hypothetical protein